MVKLSKTKKNLFSVLAAVAAVFLLYAHWETYLVEIVATTVTNGKIPAEFAAKKIVYIADIHCGEGFEIGRLDKLVKTINSLNPDILLLGGDYVSRNGKDTTACFAKIPDIIAPLGKFGVLGNHDIEAGKESVKKAMLDAGITPLVNEQREITVGGAKISIAGVDETWYGNPDGAAATKNSRDFVVFLSHDPGYLEQYAANSSQLLLAGHTHGGQITLLGIPFAGLIHGKNYKYEKGIFYEPNRTVIVTNGIGTGIVPLRFFARPQINIITLQN